MNMKDCPIFKDRDPNAVVDQYFTIFVNTDVKHSNPNGDPDLPHSPPRQDYHGYGLMSGPCIKRKIRDYVHLQNLGPGYDTWILEDAVLNDAIENAAHIRGIPLSSSDDGEETTGEDDAGEDDAIEAKPSKKKGSAKGVKTSLKDADAISEEMCKQKYDIRVFGAVLNTGRAHGSNVRGPVQVGITKSLHRIIVGGITGTSVARRTQKEVDAQNGRGRNFGIVTPYVVYGLYESIFLITPHRAKKTGFTWKDLAVLLDALEWMHLDDASGTRMLETRRILVAEGHYHVFMLAGQTKPQLRPGVVSPESFDSYYVRPLPTIPGVRFHEYGTNQLGIVYETAPAPVVQSEPQVLLVQPAPPPEEDAEETDDLDETEEPPVQTPPVRVKSKANGTNGSHTVKP